MLRPLGTGQILPARPTSQQAQGSAVATTGPDHRALRTWPRAAASTLGTKQGSRGAHLFPGHVGLQVFLMAWGPKLHERQSWASQPPPSLRPTGPSLRPGLFLAGAGERSEAPSACSGGLTLRAEGARPVPSRGSLAALGHVPEELLALLVTEAL